MSWADKQLKKHKLRKQIKEIMDSPEFQKERQKELDKHTAEAMNCFLPYERTYILSDRENVKAVCDGKSYVIGRYSTHEKAIKAMEMCRKQYMDGEYNRNSLSGVAESIGRLSEGLASVFKEGVCQTFVFKFPADEEVQEYGK